MSGLKLTDIGAAQKSDPLGREMRFMMAVQWLRDNYGGYSDDGHGFALCIDMLAEVYRKKPSEVRSAFRRVEPTPRIRGIGCVDPVQHDG